ncbi:MAG: hypothetical protein KC492_11565 [Myxococcales bacterium]|nr:hypothetical protein [Myxococcales bacterium]
MYFVDVDGLKRDLGSGPLDQRDVAIYIFLVGGAVLPSRPLLFDISGSLPVVSIIMLAHLVIAAIGVLACYRANGRAGGLRFAERFLSLSWVVGLRVFLSTLLPVVGLRLFAEHLYPDSSQLVREGLIELPVTALAYWRLQLHFQSLEVSAA